MQLGANRRRCDKDFHEQAHSGIRPWRRAPPPNAESSDKVGVICRALRRAIIEQALEPGAKLPEDSLGERFGVSRTIARHALGQLAAEGLVELRRNRIAVVATPSWQEARDAFDIRIELERLVVRQLAGKLTKAQIAALNAHVDAEDAARDGPTRCRSGLPPNSIFCSPA